MLGPGVNLARVPWGGRTFEYLGEDPFLAATVRPAHCAAHVARVTCFATQRNARVGDIARVRRW